MQTDMVKEPFCLEFYRINGRTSGDIVLCEPAQSKCTWTHYDTSQKPFCAVIYSENAGPISRDTRFVRACAIEMHMDTSQKPFCTVVCRENAGPVSRDTRFVRACPIEMHMDASQEPFCTVVYRENAGPVSRDTRFVRACPIEMHMDMSQEAFCAEIHRENAGRFRYHLVRTQGLITPQCGHCILKTLISVSRRHRFLKRSAEAFRNFPCSDPKSTPGKKTYLSPPASFGRTSELLSKTRRHKYIHACIHTYVRTYIQASRQAGRPTAIQNPR